MLSEALAGLPRTIDPNLLVGIETSDDAAVYRVAPDLAVISTVDFITPPVDDPLWFGRIAAANALSDVYAMGGRPAMALNLVLYPEKTLGLSILKEILRGGAEKIQEAGAVLAGGHTVEDVEPKYGLAVTGLVHPDRILTNCGSQPGDALILTKRLGTGVLFNACVARKLRYEDIAPLLPAIAALNAKAIEIALARKVHACTDVSGFGMAGHAIEMALGSGHEVRLRFSALPLYPDAREMYAKGVTTGSNKANRKLCEGRMAVELPLSASERELLFDPQTSGGLLLSVPAEEADGLLDDLRKGGVPDAAIVGEVAARSGETLLRIV